MPLNDTTQDTPTKPYEGCRGRQDRRPAIERFLEKVNKNTPGDCWEWQGYRLPSGYGTFSVNGTKRLVHRYSYEFHVGPIPDGVEVCHSCDNPRCCNPAHLFLGTQEANMADMTKKGRRFTKLTEAQVAEIRHKYVWYSVTYKMLAHEYGVYQSQIYNIVKRLQRANV